MICWTLDWQLMTTDRNVLPGAFQICYFWSIKNTIIKFEPKCVDVKHHVDVHVVRKYLDKLSIWKVYKFEIFHEVWGNVIVFLQLYSSSFKDLSNSK